MHLYIKTLVVVVEHLREDMMRATAKEEVAVAAVEVEMEELQLLVEQEHIMVVVVEV